MKTSIFISYSWKESKIVDQIENDLNQLQLNLVRDVRDLKYKDNIPRFMEKIRESDYALLLISDSYLKSKNCMTEALNLLKEREYDKKILPIIAEKLDIYDTKGRLQYTKFWKEQRDSLEQELSSLQSTSTISAIKDLKSIEEIYLSINDFISYVSDQKHTNYEDLRSEGYKSILDALGIEDVSHLIGLLLISLMPNTEEKEILLDEWFNSNNPTSDAYSIRAGIAWHKGDVSKAHFNYTKAISLNEGNAYALNNYGYMLLCLKREPEKAKGLFAKAIEVMPHFNEARLNLGCLLSHSFCDNKSAKEQYEEIIRYGPAEARAYNNLANIEMIEYLQSHDSAVEKSVCELYEKALELNPGYIEAHLAYGQFISELLGNFDLAEEHFKKVLDLDPRSKVLVDTLLERLDSRRKKGP
jgi:Tfp pilus assembly protein PilF